MEVLRGANGLAFGRGGNGGVINRVQKEASWSPVRELTVSGGSYGHMRGALDIGGGLSERVAGRVNVVSEQSDSFRDGVELRRNGISPTLTIQATDATKIVLGAEYFNDLRVADRGIPSQNGKPFKTDESTFFGNAAQSPTETTVKALNASVEHRFANGVLLTNKTRFADYDKYYQNVYAADAVGAAPRPRVRLPRSRGRQRRCPARCAGTRPFCRPARRRVRTRQAGRDRPSRSSRLAGPGRVRRARTDSRDRRGGVGIAGLECCHAADYRALLADRRDAAECDVLDLVTLQAVAVIDRCQHLGGQVEGGDFVQAAVVAALAARRSDGVID